MEAVPSRSLSARKVGWDPPPPRENNEAEKQRRNRIERPTFPAGAFDAEPQLLSPARKSLGELQFARRNNPDIPQSPLVRAKSERTLTEGRSPLGGGRSPWRRRVPKSPKSPKQDEVDSAPSMKRAVLIGICYSSTGKMETSLGHARDVSLLHDLLVSRFNFRSEQIWVLTDEPQVVVGAACRFRPTRALIIKAMKWLASNSKRGEQLLFSFSGYGRSFLNDGNGEHYQEEECMIPCDYPISNPIVAHEIHTTLVRDLADGATLFALFNSDDSSAIMGLPYVYSPFRTKNGALRICEELDAGDGFSTGTMFMTQVLRLGKLKKEMQLQQKNALERRDKLAAACFDNGTVLCLTTTDDKDPGSKQSQATECRGLIEWFVRFVKQYATGTEKVSYNKFLSILSSWMSMEGEPVLPKLSSSHKFTLDSTLSLLQN